MQVLIQKEAGRPWLDLSVTFICICIIIFNLVSYFQPVGGPGPEESRRGRDDRCLAR